MTLCPFASRCWMAGNYVFCKTATCKEPLIGKDAEATCSESKTATGTILTVNVRPRFTTGNVRIVPMTEEPPEEHDNGGDAVEPVDVQTIQGELF